MLCACAGIEAHDKVVAIVVFRLQLLRRLGQEEGAPVCDAANNALVIENDLSSGLRNSILLLGEGSIRKWFEKSVPTL